MTSIGKVLSNPTLMAAFPHTITAAILTAGTFVAGIGAWWMVKLARSGQADKARDVYRPAVIIGVVAMLVGGAGVALSGDAQARLMFEQQPMKMASAEALCTTEKGTSFSILAIGDLSNSCENVKHVIQIPGLTAFLANGDFNSSLPGVEDLQKQYEQKYGFTDANGDPISYQPNLAVTYWGFRLMIGMGLGSAALALAALWVTRRGRISDNKWFGRLGIAVIVTPFLASSFGWIFTEMGRQPWVVAPNPNPGGIDGVWLLTARGVSSSVSAGYVITSLTAFTLLYAVLAVFWYRLMHRYAIEGVADSEKDVSPDNPDRVADADQPLSFAY
jgi:cytochrome bd ubiquinol oxidase subunit I